MSEAPQEFPEVVPAIDADARPVCPACGDEVRFEQGALAVRSPDAGPETMTRVYHDRCATDVLWRHRGKAFADATNDPIAVRIIDRAVEILRAPLVYGVPVTRDLGAAAETVEAALVVARRDCPGLTVGDLLAEIRRTGDLLAEIRRAGK